MSLAEIVSIEVGSAIAKCILQLWIKDIPILSDISASFLDILKTKLSDRVAQRRAQRQFEEIGEKVGESLLSLFETDGVLLDEEGRTAVALAVADTFKKATISSKFLVQNNLEPTKLSGYILATSSTITDQFSEAEISLYNRIIQESCESIIDIASQLPNFTEQGFAEILKREDKLLKVAVGVLDELRQMREQLNPMVETERFELEYRRSVIRGLDVLQIFGADLSTTSRRHRLSVAYVRLALKQKQHKLHLSAFKGPKVSKTASNEQTDESIVSVEVALARSNRLLIRGMAGSGKTTLLQWIAVMSASRSFETDLSGWNSKVPFYIRLRHCIKSGLPAPENFPQLTAFAIADTMPKGWVHSKLKSGHAVVLIDGLDEVPTSRREEVYLWLKELIESFPKNYFIMTSRPHAIEDGWIERENFTDAELQPMGMSDIYTFIDHWHKAVLEEIQDETEKAELPILAKHLKEILEDVRSIRNLATNPLLCAMLCALNRDRRKQLPADRIELYEACCQLLIERRDKERNIDLVEYPTLTYRQKRILLEDLAYYLIKNGWSEIDQEQTDDRFTKKLSNMQNIPKDITGTSIRRLFVERTGILRELSVTQIDFTHRTFQEFLAARAAIDEGDVGLLIQHAHDDQWREVIILASGLGAKKVREYLVQELLNEGDKNNIYRYHLHLLAVACLEASIELSQNVKRRVEQRLAALIPPKNMEDARNLASAGELAVSYLSKNTRHNGSEFSTCIHSLALIGGDAALDALVAYADRASFNVCQALIRAWDSFDRKIYARKVLSLALKGTTELKIEQIPSLEGFEYFTGLKKLEVSFSQISDLTDLTALKQLTTLKLSNFLQVTDLRPLASLRQLTKLNLSHCERISDLSPLISLERLTTLNLSYCHQITDLSPLTELKHLDSLDLSWCRQLSDLRPLAHLKQLKTLNISCCYHVKDLTPLLELSELQTLGLYEISKKINIPKELRKEIKIHF